MCTGGRRHFHYSPPPYRSEFLMFGLPTEALVSRKPPPTEANFHVILKAKSNFTL